MYLFSSVTSEIPSFKLSAVTVQASLCWSGSETVVMCLLYFFSAPNDAEAPPDGEVKDQDVNSITEKLDEQQINGEEKLEGAGENQVEGCCLKANLLFRIEILAFYHPGSIGFIMT